MSHIHILRKADMDKGYAILVNKYTSLPEKYAPEDVVGDE